MSSLVCLMPSGEQPWEVPLTMPLPQDLLLHCLAGLRDTCPAGAVLGRHKLPRVRRETLLEVEDLHDYHMIHVMYAYCNWGRTHPLRLILHRLSYTWRWPQLRRVLGHSPSHGSHPVSWSVDRVMSSSHVLIPNQSVQSLPLGKCRAIRVALWYLSAAIRPR